MFTVCDDAANEVCPRAAGFRALGLPDPAKATGNDAERSLAFDECFRMLNQRISIFVNLPIESLSKLSLQEHLHDIGRLGQQKQSAE